MSKHLSLPARAKVYSLLFTIVGLWLAPSADALGRTWTRQNGDQFEAELVRREGCNDSCVVLRKLSGVEVTIHLWNLSEEDQQYVKQCPPTTKPATKAEPQAAEAKAEAIAEPPQTAKAANSAAAKQQTDNGRRGRLRWSGVFLLRSIGRR